MKKYTNLLGLSLLFGLIAYILFYDHIPGISVFLGTVALLVTLFFGRNKTRKVTWYAYVLGFFMLWLSASAALLSAPELLVLNILGLLVLTLALTVELGPSPVSTWTLRHYLTISIKLPFQVLGAALKNIRNFSTEYKGPSQTNNKNAAIVRGVMLALPLVVIFTILFRSANPVFNEFLGSIFNFSLDLSIQASITTIVLVAFVTFGLFGLMNSEKALHETLEPEELKKVSTEGLAFTTVLGSIFLVFLIFQAGYIFGGESNIGTSGYSYAEYLHRGFAETIVSALLTTVTLLIVEKTYGKLRQGSRLYSSSVAVMLVSTIVITLSTLYRMYIYQLAYGLSVKRLLVGIFSAWVFGVLLLLYYKLYWHKTESFFVNATVILGLAIWSLYLASNPHALIAQNHLKRFMQGKEVDTYYLRELSLDATPTLIKTINKLSGIQLETVNEILSENKDILVNYQEWQSWNLSKRRTKKLLENFSYTPPTDENGLYIYY